MIDIDIQQELQYELIDNEKLVWTGRPRRGIVFRMADIFIIPFSLFWFGMFIVIATTSVNSDMPAPAMVMFIPFLLAGFYITIGRFWVDIRRRANTIYAITDNRIIIRSGIFSKRTNSFNIKTLQNLSISEKSDGSGTISLAQSELFGMMYGPWQAFNRFSPRLESIENVKEVYGLILKLQRS